MWDEFKDYFEVEPICAVDMPVLGGVSHAERELLSRHSLHQRVNIVYEWLVRTLTLRIREGGLAAPPPITTRLYQDLSEAMEGYCDATLVSEVPFALPFMQMQVVLELVTLVLLPLVIALFTESQLAAFTFTFMTTLSLYALNEVIVELEVPLRAPTGAPPGVPPPLGQILLSTSAPSSTRTTQWTPTAPTTSATPTKRSRPPRLPKLQLGGRATLQSRRAPPPRSPTSPPSATPTKEASNGGRPQVGHLASSRRPRRPPPRGRRRHPRRRGGARAAPDRRTRPAVRGSATSVAGRVTAVQPAARPFSAPLEEAPGVSVSPVLDR